MDEVDIDNVEDLNELEARLYAQIHHEATDEEPSINNWIQHPENDCRQVIDINIHDARAPQQNYETSSNNNINSSRRYWAGGENSAKRHHQEQSHHPKQHLIRNPFRTPNNNHEQRRKVPPYSNKSQNQQQQPEEIENTSSTSPNLLKGNKTASSIQNNNKSHTAIKTTTPLTPVTDQNSVALSPSSNNENKKTQNANAVQHGANQKPPAEKSNLKLNPVADWMKRKKNQINKKASGKNNNVNCKNSKNGSTDIKQGLFARQQQKLEKAKRIEEKKQKSRKANNSTTARSNKINAIEIIDLNSDCESDSSDIIMIPIPPPPTFTVDDSGDEDDKDDNNKELITMEHEENALDSTDVQMSSTTASFTKPQEIITQSSAGEKLLENSSRCTSPCSIQSSDDFIGQTDRSRLLAGASGTADDEDLLVLTSDMNSLLEVPNISKETDDKLDNGNPIDSIVQQVQAEHIETSDSLEFAIPKTTTPQSLSKDYRVDQDQFRALDVYESESDITDTVYSKGANKSTTVIRQIDTSSDEVEDISDCSQRTKRLRKRRASSSNKESDYNNENAASSSDNENVQDDNKLLRTKIPFIAKGPAVERCKSRKRNLTLSSCSPLLQKRKSSNIITDYMSDTKFITTLNNLAQGQDGEHETKNLEEDEESETENIPTAREIAEKILAQNSATNNVSATEDMALPKDILNELEKVFETIDQFDKQNENPWATVDETVNISDSSDSDREKHFIYKSLSDEKTQIIEYTPNKLQKVKSSVKPHTENASPIYNVVYIRGMRHQDGIGWNQEMRKFYNNSWNGEHFMLSKVLQKMNPDKSLWKIYTEDRFNIKLNKRSNMKCMNCCEFGHVRSRCKRPRKPMICYMCGESGHYEPRCPNTICLRCGNKTHVFTKVCNACSFQNRLTCPICKIRGHSLDYCPDKWRRYHSTTEANIQPHSRIDYNPRRYCCICGARGHISDNCRSAVRFLEYPAVASTIKSHQKSYTDVVVRTPYNGIAVNLMYKLCQDYQFCFVEQTSTDKYYGRFLKAVGMDYLFNRKRHINMMSMEIADSTAKRTKRLSKKYEANPYLKVGTANQKNDRKMENAPNQVQEISESGSTDQQNDEKHPERDVINIEDKSDNEVELTGCTAEEDVVENIQLNITTEKANAAQFHDEKFKSPKNVASTSIETPQKSQPEPSVMLDSDSNYSFSEHFDEASSSANAPTLAETSNDQEKDKESFVTANYRRKPREMETLPDFIPLIDSTADQNEQRGGNENLVTGISRRFVAANSDDDEMEENRRNLSPLPELPCEGKIYLTHFHSKYLLAPQGNAFLVKTSQAHNLKARLDFTSVGYVLVIFGLPTNQEKFQRELQIKYRELEDERDQKQLQSNLNVPKRTYVLIKFLRESITQLMNNLGNVNHLLNRLEFHESQLTKSGFKAAEKVRRSLNMILVGQAGLRDGTMHLDKLLMSLKTLLNEVKGDVAPQGLRSEITDHWKFIFSAYRHENYQQLVDTYNKLISKNRMPQLNIDPVLLGQKVLDTTFSEEQKRKLDQPAKPPALTNATDIRTESSEQLMPNPSNQKNTKLLRRKQNGDTANASISTNKTKMTTTSQNSTNTARDENNSSSTNVKTKSNSNNTPILPKNSKSPASTSTAAKTKASSSITSTTHKSKQYAANATTNSNDNSKKQQQQTKMPPSPFSHPEKHSTVSTSIQEVTDNWKSTCDTLLTEISSEKPISNNNSNDGRSRDCKLPSTFWSRQLIRYLDDCIRLAAARPQVVEKLQRVQNKSKNGQLSYNDYLAVIKLHSALNGK